MDSAKAQNLSSGVITLKPSYQHLTYQTQQALNVDNKVKSGRSIELVKYIDLDVERIYS